MLKSRAFEKNGIDFLNNLNFTVMELEKFSVKELTTSEQIQINGGGRLAEFFTGVWEAIKCVADWIWDNLKVTLQIEVTDNINFNVTRYK